MREESLTLIIETVASVITCLEALSTSFPLMLPSVFWAIPAQHVTRVKARSVKIFLISGKMCTNLDVLGQNNLRNKAKMTENLMNDKKEQMNALTMRIISKR